MTEDFFDLMGCIQENRIKSVGLWSHVTIQSDVTIRLVDSEYVDSESFCENEDGVCCPSLKVVVVAIVTKYEGDYL